MATSIGSRIFDRRAFGFHSQRHELQRQNTMRGVSQMKKLAFGALIVGLIAACGGSSSNNNKKIILPDGSGSGGPDAPMTCNPLTQTGCAAGQKCTWVTD